VRGADCGIFYARSSELLHAVAGPGGEEPAYLSTGGGGGSSDEDMDPLVRESMSLPSPLNTHIENSTRFRALPLFCTLTALGKDGYTSIVRRNIEWARELEQWLRAEGSGWDVLTPTPSSSSEPSSESSEDDDDDGFEVMNIVLFAPSEDCPNVNLRSSHGAAEARRLINATREIYVSPAYWRGRSAIRIAVSNWMTGSEDLEKTKAVLSKVARG
jgi:glutamate/tyrosine decarboxylase-like PLP-dependent enzyme